MQTILVTKYMLKNVLQKWISYQINTYIIVQIESKSIIYFKYHLLKSARNNSTFQIIHDYK